MKIAYIPGAFFPDPGGAQVQVQKVADALRRVPALQPGLVPLLQNHDGLAAVHRLTDTSSSAIAPSPPWPPSAAAP